MSKLRIHSLPDYKASIPAYTWNKSADHLTYLELNNVQLLDTNVSLGQLTALKQLKMNHVKLHHIFDHSFYGMRNTLELLEMKNFNTGDLAELKLYELTNLRDLYLVHNTWCRYNSWSSLPNSLLTFRMQVKDLNDVPTQVMNLTSLTVLNLENNDISDITNTHVQLQTLRMKNNTIRTITSNSFQPNSRLEVLSIQENRVHLIISYTAFINVPNIKILNLTDTTFDAPVDAFTVLTKLTKLIVSPVYADFCTQVNLHFCNDVCTA